MELVNWFSGKIKESIIGQSLSSEAGGTGMGSGVANLHADTLSRIIRYHADALADSMSFEFVRVVAAMLGASPEDADCLEFQFAPERPDPKERLEAIEKFVAMGGRVSQAEVRDLLGLSEPTEDEPILGKSDMQTDNGNGAKLDDPAYGNGAELDNDPTPPEGEQPRAGAPKEFSRRSWW